MSEIANLVNETSLTLTAIMIDVKANFAKQTGENLTENGGNRFALSGKFLELHTTYSTLLEQYKIEHEQINQRIRDEHLKFEAVPEIKDFFKRYEKLLRDLNKDCIVELACSSKV